MRARDLAVVIIAGVLPSLSCGSSTPTQATPSPSPSPSATPTPPEQSPWPSPSPSPTASPSGDPEDSGLPAVYATAGVHSYRRNGNLVRSGAQTYKPGDIIYLNCTPRDQ